jgi:hypothetical protein
MQKTFLALLLAFLLVVSNISCGGGGGTGSGTGGGPPSPNLSTSLSTNSASPFSPLKIATTGLSLDNTPIQVTYSAEGSNGFSAQLPPFEVDSDGSVWVGVPVFFDNQNIVGAGKVNVTLTQGGRSSSPQSFSISDLPSTKQLNLAPGKLSRAFFIFAAQVIANRIQRIDETSVILQNMGENHDLSQSRNMYTQFLNKIISARNDIDRIYLDNTVVINAGKNINGTPININLGTINAMDRMFAAWANQYFGINTTSSPASGSYLNPILYKKSERSPIARAPSWNNVPEILGTLSAASDYAVTVRDPETTDNKMFWSYNGVSASLLPHVVDASEKNMAEAWGNTIAVGATLLTIETAVTDSAQLYLDAKAGKDITQGLITLEKNRKNLWIDSLKLLAGAGAAMFPPAGAATAASLMFISAIDLAIQHQDIVNAQLEENLRWQKVANYFEKNKKFEQADIHSSVINLTRNVSTVPESVKLCCFGPLNLEIEGITDESGNYTIPVPLGMNQTDYSKINIKVSDPNTNSNVSTFVDLTGVDTTKPVQIPPMTVDTTSPCTYSYSAWSACQSNNTQTRTLISSSPAGCVGTPVLTQSCTYIPPTQQCTYTYSDWSACQSNNTQSRTLISSSPSGCEGTPGLSQSCTYTCSLNCAQKCLDDLISCEAPCVSLSCINTCEHTYLYVCPGYAHYDTCTCELNP